ncbi:hypothetical protein PAEAM_55880 [Paenibacillus sp. GM1FR]|uniref:phosphotransferase n=1 Tax=Paenibacillus sp. GM1FR TaxID=2059267 RepID=UPI000C2724F8|nr:phosphotransferase [Paenibacillus sp. GM1FR]PJN49976.1 hypothetical protein PAEAM_55880 [Paenibacillus sp. GM1FR]
MNDTQYNLNFEKLCNELQLGELISSPKPISGGLLHRMYAIETTQANYAVKALNPQIMIRPTAVQNYIDSEKIASVAAEHIHAQPAKRLKGASMHNIDNQFYLIFDWIEGQRLEQDEVTINNSSLMGTILADIHKTDFRQLELHSSQVTNSKKIDWMFYLNKGKNENSEWIEILNSSMDKLYEWSMKAKKSSSMLASENVISHRDLEPKNVMWRQDIPIIIDWESAGYINPMHDLVETAVYWSVDSSGSINKEKFLAFIAGYEKQVGSLTANWDVVLDNGFAGKLDWLEYSLKRSLWIECTDIEEQLVGTSQVIWTLEALKQYENMISDIKNWLNT